MTPTQAQIDAAAKALANQYADGDWQNYRGSALVALTAAAEAGDDEVMMQSAEVAQMDVAGRLGVAIKRIEILERRNAATIERCAQVAKAFIEGLIDPKSKTMSHWDEIRGQVISHPGSDLPRLNFESLIETIAEEAAAAIRALKDKP